MTKVWLDDKVELLLWVNHFFLSLHHLCIISTKVFVPMICSCKYTAPDEASFSSLIQCVCVTMVQERRGAWQNPHSLCVTLPQRRCHAYSFRWMLFDGRCSKMALLIVKVADLSLSWGHQQVLKYNDDIRLKCLRHSDRCVRDGNLKFEWFSSTAAPLITLTLIAGCSSPHSLNASGIGATDTVFPNPGKENLPPT